ncbi:tetratricopeptide repeat protein [Brumimicrobium aurantiacum]|uniref:Tetratricopeptide repeat protein n=1 Tax=Brumimicrobium aurantiacum TaxID=1737063 RepID=A0A3E1F027_9FLAO|nr:tetratricopeptide repeat protein [Brumimicrobium aurantiacum]RFC55166.1 tetratricopeptide repeat protein [Brumimicrobium aurantiacum]
MFEEENEDDWLNNDYQRSLAIFDQMYANNEYKYIDSDDVEYILDQLLISNQLKKAQWAAEQALYHFPNNSSIIIRLAQILSLTGDVNTALKKLLSLEQIEPNNLDVLLSIATCYSQLKHSIQSIKYFRKALEIASSEEQVDIAIDLAMELESTDDYKSAIKVLSRTIEVGHVNDLLVYELAHCYEKIGDNENAVKSYLDYIDEDPYSYTTWYNLGNTYSKIDNTEKAIWAYEYAILIQDDFVPALYNIANAYLDANKIEEALEYYKKCLALDKNDPMVFCSMGECYEELDLYEKAYEMYNKSTVLLPQLADAWLGKGIMSDMLGNHAKAVQELLVAVDLEPEKAEIWRSLANAYENKEQNEQALSSYEKAIQLEPNNKEIIIDYLSFLAGQSIESVFDAVSDHKDLRDNLVVTMVLCYCNWMLGNHTEAMLNFDEVLENDANLAKSLFLHFPEMKNATYFVDRMQEFDERKDNEKF